MAINIGSTIKFVAQEKDTSTQQWETVSEVTIARKEFDANQFQGVGYQSVLISDNFGQITTHSMGFTGQATDLQINNKAVALPMYRFDFGFVLDSDRLGEMMEIYLLQYNRLSRNIPFRILMQDLRLVISEPNDSIHKRESFDIIEDNSANGWIEKNVQFYIFLENVQFNYLTQDLYTVNILANESNIVTDQKDINVCVPATEEVGVPQFEGFTVTEINLPSNLIDTNTSGSIQGIGINEDGLMFAHAFLEDENYFIRWDENNANTSLVTYQVSDIVANEEILPSEVNNTFLNTRVYKNSIISFMSNPRNTEQRWFHFDSQADTFETVNIESATNISINQLSIATNPGSTNYVTIPRQVSALPVNSATNNTVETLQFRYKNNDVKGVHDQVLSFGLTDDRLNIPIPGSFLRTEVEDDHIILGFSRKRPGIVKGLAGTLWYKDKLLLDEFSTFETYFEFDMTNSSKEPTPADGMCFVIHNDARGLNSVGKTGSALGLSDIPENRRTGNSIDISSTSAFTGIRPSVSVAFDLWFNKGVDPLFGGAPGDLGYGYGMIVEDANFFNASPKIELSSNAGVVNLQDKQRKHCWVNYSQLTNILEVRISNTPVRPATATFSKVTDILTDIGSSAYIGFVASTGGSDMDIILHSWYFKSNTRFQQGLQSDPTESRYSVWSNDTFVNNRSTPTGLIVPTNELTIASVAAPFSGVNIYYHRLGGPVYRSNTPNWSNSNRVQVATTSPIFKHGIQHSDGSFKFYLTQGVDLGDVYTTEDWINYTNIGVWDEVDNTLGNEGHIYRFREQYLVKASKFLLDIENDEFIFIDNTTCPNQTTTLFDTDRNVTAAYSIDPSATALLATNGEQIIMCDRFEDISQNIFNDIRCWRIIPTKECPTGGGGGIIAD